MNNREQQFVELEKLMKEMCLKYNKIINSNDEYKNKFGGFKVWYSPVKFNPKFLIIGINPGINETTPSKKIRIKPGDKFEYLNANPVYNLAKFQMDSFRLANLESVFKTDTIKTNFYHIITETEKDIKCLNKIEKGLYAKYDKDSLLITKKIIDIISPKIILCEGKSIYERLVTVYNKIGDEWINEQGYTFVSKLNLIILGFSRKRGYNSEDKIKSFSEYLKKVI